MSQQRLPFEVDVSSRYGAPMGRRSDLIQNFVGKVHLRRVPLFDGDYDRGGAYWGGDRFSHVYCAWDNHGNVLYCRAGDREEARNKICALTEDLADLKFYR